jgi:hypothetical protein
MLSKVLRFFPRLRLVYAAAAAAAVLSLASPASAADGDYYWDGCPADATFTMVSGGYSTTSGTNDYWYRPNCPWYLIDFTGAASLEGHPLEFHGGWDLAQPDNEADCLALHASYAVSLDLGGTLYQVVAHDEMSGEWSDGFCYWRRHSGQSTIKLTGTNNRYRLLVRAESHGAGAPVWGWGFLN